MTYDFRSMTAENLPMVRNWLARPHVREWWPDGDDFEFVSGDLAHPDLVQFVIFSHGQPFAYLQCYRLSEWDAGFGPQPEGTRGIDQFIGEPDMLGIGHGSAMVRQFCDALFVTGVPKVLVDPNPLNLRAIRAYENAGFRRIREITTPDGAALMMERNP